MQNSKNHTNIIFLMQFSQILMSCNFTVKYFICNFPYFTHITMTNKSNLLPACLL